MSLAFLSEIFSKSLWLTENSCGRGLTATTLPPSPKSSPNPLDLLFA